MRRHPAFPTPFSSERRKSSLTPRAHSRRENAEVCVALRRMPIDVVIASAAKQSSFELRASPHDGLLRCARMRKRFAFVAAMTVETVCRDPHSPSIVPRRQGPITAGSSFALRPPTQQPSCPALVPGIHVLARRTKERGWPGQPRTSPATTIPFKRGIRISARCRHPVFPTPFPWKGGEFSHNSDAFAPRESRHSRVVPHAGLPRHSPLATHHSSSPRRRGPSNHRE